MGSVKAMLETEENNCPVRVCKTTVCSKRLSTASETDWLTTTQVERGLQGNCGATQSKREEVEWTREVGELNQIRGDWESPCEVNRKSSRLQKVPDLEKRAENQKIPTGRKENAGPKCVSDGVRGKSSPKVKYAPTDALLEGPRGSSTNCKGRTSRSSQRSDHSGKENQPQSCDRPEMCRRNPYSPEQVHEFMKKKVAERNKRIQGEKWSSRQACEARNIRLQEVYRKQREALGRKKGRTEALRVQGGATPTTYAKHNQDPKGANNKQPDPEVTKWLHQTSSARLRNEVKLRSDFHPTRAKSAEVTRMLDSPLSLAPECGFTSTLNLKDLLIPSSPTAQCIQSPFLSPKRPTEAPEAQASSDSPGLSPYRNKQDRVRAVHILARSLSERLEREMERLQVTDRPGDSRDPGWPPRTPDLSERPCWISEPEVSRKEFGATANAGAILGLSHLQSLSTHGQNRRERALLEEGSTTQATKERIQPLLSVARTGDEVLETRTSPEGTPGMRDTKWLKKTHEGCAANEEGFEREGGLLPGDPRAQPSVPPPPPQFLVRRPSTSSQAEGYNGPHQNTGMGEGSKTNLGPQPGQCRSALPQQWGWASGPSPPPSAKPHCNTITAAGESGDGSEAAESTSQWSEMSQFYGGSSTFCRFGLTMVEQYLREEELRARHQSALLRLREKALQEKAKAELAWLEHQKCCQDGLHDAAGVSATIEKQCSLLTKLKQEQAEIQHLQNVGRAAHQERKLLLKQQKDLLLVQQSTAQLWQRLCKLAGTLPQQDAGNPTSFEGATDLGKESGEEASSFAPFIATCSGRSGNESNHSPQQSGNSNNLCAESRETVSQGKTAAEEFPSWKRCSREQDAKSSEMTSKDLHSSRERPVGSTLKAGGGTEIAGYLVSKAEEEHCEDASLIKSSKEDHPRSSLDKELESLASTVSFAKLYGFSPDLESPQFNPEFQKAHAILIDISGSSLSASDLEADDAEDTDISLPEEFIFQEEPHDGSGAAVFRATPPVPQIVISGETLSSSGKRCHVQASCGHSNRENSSFMSSQEKTLEDTSHGDGIYEPDSVMLSSNGKPRLNSSRTGESLSFQDHASTTRRKSNDGMPRLNSSESLSLQDHASTTRSNATSLNSNSVNEVASRGTPALEAAPSSVSVASHCPEDQRWQGTVPAISTVEEDGDHENTFHFKGKYQAVMLPPNVSLKNTDSIGDPFQGSPFQMSVNMPSSPLASLSSSEDRLVSNSGTHSAERSVDECESRRPDEAAAEVTKAPMACEEAGVSLLCPKTTEGTARENQNSSPTNSQCGKESGMLTLPSSSPQTGKLFQNKSCLLRCEDDTVLLNNEHLPEMEDDISSPVDEVLSYGSTDLPSSTEKDASFQSEDLPAPPEDMNRKSDDSNISLQDFPSPPEQLVFPETGELPYSMDEISDLPSLSDHLGPRDLPPSPGALADVSSAPKLPSGQ